MGFGLEEKSLSDVELELLKLKKLRELEKRLREANLKHGEEKFDPYQTVEKMLVGRGREVLEAAYRQYPEIAKAVVQNLALLIKSGRLKEPISGELLYEIFRVLGFPVRLETKIVFKKHGETKSLAEKIREEIS